MESKVWYKRPIYKPETDAQTSRSDFVVAKGGGREGNELGVCG